MSLNLKIYSEGKECCWFSNMDPTVIIKIHSIVSGKDIVELQKSYDYEIKKISDDTVSMLIPDDFINKLKSLSKSRFKNATQEWLNSTEVKMNAYSFDDCEEYLELLKNCILKE